MKNSTATLSIEKMFILDQCALIETKCADMYRYLAQKYASIPELAALWIKTANEEDNHAMQFQILKKTKGRGIIDVAADCSSVSEGLKKVESLFNQIMHSSFSPVEAVQLALKLESYLGRFHSASVTICNDEATQNLLKAMMANDLGHENMLKEMLDKLLVQKDY
jgi:rubrerythrin